MTGDFVRMLWHPSVPLILGAALAVLLPKKLRAPLCVLAAICSLGVVTQLESGLKITFDAMSFQLEILRVDELSKIFGFIFALIAALGCLYAAHVKERLEPVTALLYAAGALGVTFAGDLLTLFVWWEVMALTAAVLIWTRHSPLSTAAGFRYLMMHLAGGSVMMAGILLQWSISGSLAWDAAQLNGLAGGLILTGLLVNAAAPPLHAWLPDSYPEATVTGAVFLSAFTTKAAVYCLIRGFAGWEILTGLGVVMTLYGVVYAVLENDIRRLLGYHIISQVGYMVAAVGLGTETALNGAAAHAFCHILYKALLFMGAGAVLQAAGSAKLTELGGLYPRLKTVFWLYMIGALSISGFPLFNGFISKSMIVYAAHEAHVDWAFYGLQLAAVGTFLSVGLKLPWYVWISKPHAPAADEPARNIQRIPANMNWAMGLTGLACFAIGVRPDILYRYLPYPVDYSPYTWPHVFEAFQILTLATVAFFILRKILRTKDARTPDVDWFYRVPGRRAASALVSAVNLSFDFAENGVRRLVKIVVLPAYDANKNRGPLLTAGMWLLVFLVGLSLWIR